MPHPAPPPPQFPILQNWVCEESPSASDFFLVPHAPGLRVGGYTQTRGPKLQARFCNCPRSFCGCPTRRFERVGLAFAVVLEVSARGSRDHQLRLNYLEPKLLNHRIRQHFT